MHQGSPTKNGGKISKGSNIRPEASGTSTSQLPPNRVEAARVGEAFLFRVVGLATVHTALPLWDFVEQAMANGCRCFAFDLAECKGLDSTFMGTMVGISLDVRELAGEKGWVCALNVSEANLELLRLVGADRFLRFKSNLKMEPIETEPLTPEGFTLEKRIALVKRAHENLLAIDRRNEERFGDFLRYLAAELSQGSGGSAPAGAES